MLSVEVALPTSWNRMLLGWARELQAVDSHEGLLQATAGLMQQVTRYRHCWLGVFSDDLKNITILSGLGLPDMARLQAVQLAEFAVGADPLIEEITRSLEPVIVVDARTDPRPRQDQVAKLQNRTIINVPLMVDGQRLGLFGTGTFGPEGVVAPTEDEIAALVSMSSYVSVVLGRLQAEARRAEMAEQLRHATRMEALGLLAGGVAHDFNNLLTVILCNLDVAASIPGLPAEAREFFSNIDAATSRAANLSRQLLAFARKQVVEVHPLDLNALLAELSPLLRRLLSAEITLHLLPREGLRTVVADPSQLEQVIINLLINARDAISGTGRIRIETETVHLDDAFAAEHAWARPGAFVALSITDTGTGMDAETRARIFDPFFTTKGEQGTGLGLSVVFGIVEQHRGLIRVHSEPGVGATFTVYLPASDEAPAARDAQPPQPAVGGREHILLAEDSAQIRDVIQIMLTQAGYRVTLARDGQEALSRFRDAAPPVDMVISDMVMPKVNGSELLAALRAEAPWLPVLLISAYAGSRTKVIAARRNTGALAKPFRRTVLLQRVRALLDERSGTL